jgi:hypothetical protein
MPFAKTPNYRTEGYNNKSSFSICPAVKNVQDEWIYASARDVVYRLKLEDAKGDTARVDFDCIFADGIETTFECTIDKEGILVCVNGENGQEVGICLPIFIFDGERDVKIDKKDGKIIVEYDSWACEYKVACMQELNEKLANRNGIYECYLASGKEKVALRIKIYPCV